MRNVIDFSSWQTALSALFGLAVITLVMVGIRLLVMQTVQQRRERENRQINERLRTLIAAYKTLGGSFTGDLAVDPAHLRDVHVRAERERSIAPASDAQPDPSGALAPAAGSDAPSSERRRRVRDAVEAALSDVILLGTEEQVRLAAQAATDLAAGRAVHTAEIVVSLRNFIRQVLDLDAVPAALSIPKQGPLRPVVSAARGGARGAAGNAGGGGGGRGGGGAGGGEAGVGVGSPGRAIDADAMEHR